ncbi:MAG TPA: histidine triad nucleotide-binding protein [Candidatus Limnocylindria bacterium]|nr:histidine triad nucleotide-binding protein [Candidatus Limnocylindria bacterium]
MQDCLFCRIVAKSVPSTVVYEDDEIIAINDVFPRAPFHVMVMPKRHVARLSDLEDPVLAGGLIGVVRRVAKGAGHKDYRVVVNNGPGAGQSVEHLHIHVMAGRSFEWPPG